MIAAGKLDRRITIEVIGPATDDGMRSKPGGWLKLCDRWAALMPLTGAERVAAAEKSAVVTQRFRIRRDSSFTPNASAYRIRYAGQIYDLVLVQEVGKSAWELTGTAAGDGVTVE